MFGMKLLAILASTAFLATAFKIARQSEDTENTPVFECGDGNSETYYFLDDLTGPVTITSNNFQQGGYYGNYNKCVVTFFGTEQPRILTFTFGQVDLEYSYFNCTYDAICVGGELGCGTELTGSVKTVHIPSYGRATFAFKSDGSVTDRGFEVEVTSAIDTSDLAGSDENTCYDYAAGISYYNDGAYTDNYVYTSSDDYETGNPPCDSNNGEYATGDYEYATGDYEYATGDYEYATGDYEYATGDYEYATGDYEYATGDYEYATGDYEYATGDYEYATGDYEYATGK